MNKSPRMCFLEMLLLLMLKERYVHAVSLFFTPTAKFVKVLAATSLLNDNSIIKERDIRPSEFFSGLAYNVSGKLWIRIQEYDHVH